MQIISGFIRRRETNHILVASEFQCKKIKNKRGGKASVTGLKSVSINYNLFSSIYISLCFSVGRVIQLTSE
jgi:hypothetical protein